MSSTDKGRLTQQMQNNMKMHAYLNKNTFSRVTDKPPEENRLNWNDIINKGSQPSWKKGDSNDEDPLVMSKKQEKRREAAENNEIKDTFGPPCRKCNETGHFTFECMNLITKTQLAQTDQEVIWDCKNF
jgi:hypothetical protein